MIQMNVNRLLAPWLTRATHAVILYAAGVGGAGSTKMCVPWNVLFISSDAYAWQVAPPSCAICRVDLHKCNPLIPNLVVDKIVEKYIKALCTNRIDGWDVNGTKFKAWQERKG